MPEFALGADLESPLVLGLPHLNLSISEDQQKSNLDLFLDRIYNTPVHITNLNCSIVHGNYSPYCLLTFTPPRYSSIVDGCEKMVGGVRTEVNIHPSAIWWHVANTASTYGNVPGESLVPCNRV